MEVLVRPAGEADLPALIEIEQEAFAPPWSETALKLALSDERTVVLVAQHSGQIAGYVSGWAVGDEGEISRLAVSQSARRHGLGTLLLEEIVRYLAGQHVARVFLEVRQSNIAALGLYRKAGFKQVGVRRKYYADGEDAVVMAADVA